MGKASDKEAGKYKYAKERGASAMKRKFLIVIASVLAISYFSAAAWSTRQSQVSVVSQTGACSVTYKYDRLHRLVSATYADGTHIAYGYDTNGNRVTKSVSRYIHRDSEPRTYHE